MKIDITTDEEEPIYITNDGFDNPNFVEIVIGNKEATVFIPDLLAAAIAFDYIRDQYKEDEQE